MTIAEPIGRDHRGLPEVVHLERGTFPPRGDELGLTTHELQTLEHHFDEVWAGAKTAELRRDDRGFNVGDALWLRETRVELNPPGYPELRGGAPAMLYTGRQILAIVTHVLGGPALRELVPPGTTPFVMLSLDLIGRYRPARQA